MKLRIAFLGLGLLCASGAIAEDIPFEKDASERGVVSNGYRTGTILDAKIISMGGELGGLNPISACLVTLNVGELRDGVYAKKTRIDDSTPSDGQLYYQTLTNINIATFKEIRSDEATDKTDIIRINPWQFRTDSNRCAVMGNLKGSHVVVHYYQSYDLVTLDWMQTPYQMINMFPVRDKHFSPLFVEAKAGDIQEKRKIVNCPILSKTCPGSSVGKILKVSYRGKYINSWEMQIVEGPQSTGRILMMSIPDRKIARWAIFAMVSGMNVRVYHDTVKNWLYGMLKLDSYAKDTIQLVSGMELLPRNAAEEAMFASNSMIIEKTVPVEVIVDAQKKHHLDNYLWEKFIDKKRGIRSFHEIQQEAERDKARLDAKPQ